MGKMAKSDYQMTTVYKYLELLDNDLSAREKAVRSASEKYLINQRRNNRNAELLEKLLG